ncbi:TIGR02680 family protein [Kitasatospora sp. NPDC088134]|uniref:TIGR02680 family protein n=1 Tax=Kitasatospora sp. NPDC088134 TaxID=3364071 RepID=UPI00382EC6D8
MTPRDESLQALLEGRLPLPARERFQPLRMGLLGIWEYDEQEFFFHDGKLILRGHNGSGKTKALEVTSPLLLDARLDARRLDPFGTAARTMRENLLYAGRTQQVGYTWCEYGRRTEGGNYVFLTIGIGMHADTTAKNDMKDPWFFVTDRRIGEDLHLYDPRSRRPYGKKMLTEQLGADSVFKNGKEYRDVVAQRLFGFSAARLRALVNLLLTLRRPKLSANFDAERLSVLLRQSLPAISANLVTDLAGKFDELVRDREELAGYRELGGHLEAFLGDYGRFAKQHVRVRSQGLVDAAEGLRAAQAAHAAHLDLLVEARAREDDERRRSEELAAERLLLDARERELSASPQMTQQRELDRLQQELVKRQEHLDGCRKRHEAATRQRVKAESLAENRQLQLQTALAELVETESDTERAVGPTRMVDVHRDHRQRLRTAPEETGRTLTGYVDARRDVLAKASEHARRVDEARHAHDAHEAVTSEEVKKRVAAKEQADTAAARLGREVQALNVFLTDWSDRCRELRLPVERLAVLLLETPKFGAPGARSLSELITAEMEPLRHALTVAGADLRAEQKQLRSEQQSVARLRARVAAQTDPEPGPPAAPRRDRTAELDDGAPLWKLLEFNPETPTSAQAGIEAALLGAGMLDAWVTADGRVLDPGTLETVWAADADPLNCPSLADVLVPATHPAVSRERVQRLLRSVGLKEHDGPVPEVRAWVGCDGTWRNGELGGRSLVAAAGFIGAAARAAERLRRLAALDADLLTLDEKAAELRGRSDAIRHRQDDLIEECNELRDRDIPVVTAQGELAKARTAYELVNESAETMLVRQRELAHALTGLRTVADEFGRTHQVSTRQADIAVEDRVLLGYRGLVQEVVHRAVLWNDRTQEAATAVETLRELVAAEEERAEEHTAGLNDVATAEEQISVRVESLDVDVAEVVAALAACREQSIRLNKALAANKEAGIVVGKQVATLEEQARAKTVAVEEHGGHRATAVARFAKLGDHGYFQLADVPGIGPAEEVATAALERLAQERTDDAARNRARAALDHQYRMLQTELSDPHWRPRWDYDDDLVIVSILHNGTSISVPSALDRVTGEVDSRESLLDSEERKLFTDVVLGGMGEHLRRRRASAAELIARMNALLGKVPTASGMVMQLVWEAAPEQSPEAREALKLLDSGDSLHLSDESRETLIRFLVDRVEAARQKDGVGGDWKAQLRDALDYRAWSRVRIQSRIGETGRFTDLTNEKQQRGSGGEKAVMLQLPLFVAAAAHYAGAAAWAPRPVYLDEAFAGVDSDMRGRCLGLLTALDLDVVMASHDEWGFHTEVPGVATHQLFRHPDTPGVLVTPMIWDGNSRHALTDPALGRLSMSDGLDWEDDEDEGEDAASRELEAEDDNDTHEAWSVYQNGLGDDATVD